MRRAPRKGNLEKEIKTLLIDGNALFKTGYHGAINEYNDSGRTIGGIYQFIVIMKKLIEEKYYDRVFVFWDGKFSGKLRYDIYSDYKGNRNKDYINGTIPDDKDQILQRLIVQEYLEELFIRQLEDEIVESDDFISYFCNTKGKNEKITICTNDRDLCQLINEDITIYLCDKKRYVTIGNYNEFFKHHYTNSALVKIISGDNSDNIKGIKGVKEPSLLKFFPFIAERNCTLLEILENASRLQEERVKNKKKPLKVFDNLINSVTDGIQGKDIYKINTNLVDLTTPQITMSGIEKLENLKDGVIDPNNRGIKNIINLMKRDGIDKKFSDVSEYLIPFNRLIEREKKMFNKN
jgi:5'-3' exonuclease